MVFRTRGIDAQNFFSMLLFNDYSFATVALVNCADERLTNNGFQFLCLSGIPDRLKSFKKCMEYKLLPELLQF